MERYLLGVDVGTSSVKVAIIDESGAQLGLSSAEHPVISPREGWQEVSSKLIWEAFRTCTAQLINGGIDPKRIAGIGISCLCPGLVAFNEDGDVIHEPIIYSDRRSIAEAEEIKEKVGMDRLFSITANNCMSGAISGTSMLWIKHNRPDIYEKTRYFGHINSMMAAKMTGKIAIDHSNASYTSVFETVGSLRWSEDLCEAIGLDIEKLPPLLSSSGVVGGLIAKDLIDLGIPAGTPVVIGGGDTACASLAAGIVKNGDVCDSSGTTNVLTVCVNQPKFDRGFINRCHVVPGTWIYQGAMSHAGSSFRWIRDKVCPDVKKQAAEIGVNAFDMLTMMAKDSPAGANGVVFLPYMMGERSPVWDSNARGVFFGLSLDTERRDLIRAVLEACGYGTRQLKEMAEQLTGLHFDRFYALGGGAKSEVWSQIKADIMGVDLDVLDMNDMAPVGAALLAGVGTGIFRDPVDASEHIQRKLYKRIYSSDENHAVYNKRFEVYKELYPRLKELYDGNRS